VSADILPGMSVSIGKAADTDIRVRVYEIIELFEKNVCFHVKNGTFRAFLTRFCLGPKRIMTSVDHYSKSLVNRLLFARKNNCRVKMLSSVVV
jgi:hypothetical protein